MMLAECIFTDIRLIFELQCECQGDRQCIVLKPGMAEYRNAECGMRNAGMRNAGN